MPHYITLAHTHVVMCDKNLLTAGNSLDIKCVAQQLGCQTFDQAVKSSIPCPGIIKSPRSTQPSIPPR